MACKFKSSSAAAAPKRAAPAETTSAAANSPAAKFVPAVSQLTIEQGPRPNRTAQRKPTTANFVVCIYKVTDDAGGVWTQYQGKAVALYAVVMEHDCRPSATYQIRDSFNEFLAKARKENESIPEDVRQMEELGLRLVVTDQADPDGVGTYVQWRPVFYIAGDDESVEQPNCFRYFFCVWGGCLWDFLAKYLQNLFLI